MAVPRDKSKVKESPPSGRPALAHFVYFSSKDEVDARITWQALAGASNIDKSELTVETTGETLSSSPIIASSDRASVFFSIHHNTIAVGATFELEEGAGSGSLDLDNTSRTIWNASPSAIGNTSVLAAGAEGLANAAELVFGQTLPPIPAAENLFLIRLGDGRHLYAYGTKSFEDPIDFFAKSLTRVDGLLHKLEKIVPHFKEQASAILDKRDTCEKTVASILNEQVDGEGSDKERSGMLEADVRRLAEIYADLTGDLSVIRKSRDMLERDLDYLSDQLGTLNYNPDRFGLDGFREVLDDIGKASERLDESLNNVQAAIVIVGTRVELLRSKENITLQKEALSLQVAAGFIEFIILFYYALHSWETLVTPARFERVPAGFRALLTLAFAGIVVALTHQISKAFRGESRGYLVTILMVAATVGVLFLMAVLPYAP